MSKTTVTKQLSIKDIPAQKIKDLMLEHEFENPTETAISIARAAFTFAELLDDHDGLVGREVVDAFYILERLFNVQVELMDLTKIKAA